MAKTIAQLEEGANGETGAQIGGAFQRMGAFFKECLTNPKEAVHKLFNEFTEGKGAGSPVGNTDSQKPESAGKQHRRSQPSGRLRTSRDDHLDYLAEVHKPRQSVEQIFAKMKAEAVEHATNIGGSPAQPMTASEMDYNMSQAIGDPSVGKARGGPAGGIAA